ncbi:MAG: S1C family serine protease [Oscillospiraceae bacterium]
MYYDPNHPEEPIPTNEYRVEDIGPAAPQEQPPKKEKKKRFWPKALALCLVCTLLGGIGGVAGSAYFSGANSTNSTDSTNDGGENSTTIYESDREPAAVTVSYTNTGKEMSTEEIYASWVNSTVGISTEIVTTNYFGQQVSAAAGSGFVISSDGYIVTNYHVIEGASTIKVTFYDGTVYDATLVGGEQSNDVAVLKIDAKGLKPVIIGDSDAVNVGQAVTAIGNPLGELTFSQTAGIISAKDRTVTLTGGIEINMLQTDCTINSGNSGGPLFNNYGEVIGITSAKYSNNGSYSEATIEGIGFAIPINDVIDIIQDLIEHGYVTGKPSVGIIQTSVTDAVQRYGIPAGAEVLAVLDGSCAEKGGLQVGDIITAVGETKVESSSDLQSAIKNCRAGDTVTFTVYRSGQSINLRLILDEYNQERSDAMDALNEEYQESQKQTTQQPSSNGNGYNFSWPFGW